MRYDYEETDYTREKEKEKKDFKLPLFQILSMPQKRIKEMNTICVGACVHIHTHTH